MADFQKLKKHILKWEGGYVNDPYDLGGHTNKGITLATFRTYCGQDKTVEDLKNITDEEWDKVFDSFVWKRIQGDRINNENVAMMIGDWVWSSGVYGISIPQRMLGTATDGILGFKTLSKINAKGSQGDTFAREIAIERIRYCHRICKTRPQNKRFLKGWINRVNDLVKLCGLKAISSQEIGVV